VQGFLYGYPGPAITTLAELNAKMAPRKAAHTSAA
jgi:hypothetical protein